MMFRLSAIALLVFFASTFGTSQVGNAVRVTPIEKELSLRFFSLGSLSKNDGDGYERVIYKLNLRCSNGRCQLCPRPSKNVNLRTFHVVVVQ